MNKVKCNSLTLFKLTVILRIYSFLRRSRISAKSSSAVGAGGTAAAAAGILPPAEGCCRRNRPQYPESLAGGVPDVESPRRFVGLAVQLRYFLTAFPGS